MYHKDLCCIDSFGSLHCIHIASKILSLTINHYTCSVFPASERFNILEPATHVNLSTLPLLLFSNTAWYCSVVNIKETTVPHLTLAIRAASCGSCSRNGLLGSLGSQFWKAAWLIYIDNVRGTDSAAGCESRGR